MIPTGGAALALQSEIAVWGTTGALGILVWDLTAQWSRPPARRRPDVTVPSPLRSHHADRRSVVDLTYAEAVASVVGVVALTVITMWSALVGLIAVSSSAGFLLHRRRDHRRRTNAVRDAALPELVDSLVALIRSGLTPTLAWRELPACTPPALEAPVRRVIALLDRGWSFSDALADVLDELGSAARGLFDALVTAERYGLPLVPTLDRLANEAATERRRLVETRGRQLPVRMSLPLVVCTLPAFTLLGIVPILAATLSSLRRP